jgi:hypothetical protein
MVEHFLARHVLRESVQILCSGFRNGERFFGMQFWRLGPILGPQKMVHLRQRMQSEGRNVIAGYAHEKAHNPKHPGSD